VQWNGVLKKEEEYIVYRAIVVRVVVTTILVATTELVADNIMDTFEFDLYIKRKCIFLGSIS
jgi:hypothetical protein